MKNVKVLVVDDMFTIRKVISNYLENFGFSHINQAKDGEEAWKMILDSLEKGSPFQLIICDWSMPKVTGMELLMKIRESDELRNIPFLMVTAESEQQKVMEIVRAGVSDFVVKPFTKETLEVKIEKVLGMV